ncbi:MAG: ABC transporter substrate-binding protein [Vitreoscilla sp.]|nr:ABC transporter substrate-binding protein [Vitreoscilla sp.]
MNRNPSSLWAVAVALACAPMAVLCASPATAWGTEPDEALLREGRQLYQGLRPFEAAPQLAGVALPNGTATGTTASTACHQCHGPRGEGQREGGVVAPAIHWQALRQASARQAGYGSGTEVLQAITAGIGRNAQPLQPPMPQFALGAREQQALLAYLQVLGTEADPVPGVSPSQVQVATVLPLTGPQAAAGQRVRDTLQAHFAATNARGGIFGRRIELQVLDGGPNAAGASRATLALLGEGAQQPFAVVGSLLADPDEHLRSALAAQDLALVATLGMPLADSPLPQLTYLLPSVSGQVQLLAAELARQCGAGRPMLVLHPPGAAWAQTLGHLPQDGRTVHAQAVANADEMAAALRAWPAHALVATLGGPLLAQLRAAARPQCLGTLAAVSGPAPATQAGAGTEVVALPMPAWATGAAGADSLWAVLADAAASVFEEALARSGRPLDRRRFQQALHSLHRFEPAPGLALTFTPSRRHGFDVTYLWTENHHAAHAH